MKKSPYGKVIKRWFAYFLIFNHLTTFQLFAVKYPTNGFLPNEEFIDHFRVAPHFATSHKGFLKADRNEVKALTLGLRKNTTGSYYITLNPDFFNDKNNLFILDDAQDNEVIGHLISNQKMVSFIGAEGYNFTIESPLELSTLDVHTGGKVDFLRDIKINENASLKAHSLSFNGRFQTTGALEVNVQEDIVNKNYLESGKNLITHFKNFTNYSYIKSHEEIIFKGANFSTANKTSIESEKNTYVDVSGEVSNNGSLAAKETLVVQANTLKNRETLSSKDLSIKTKDVLNNLGTIHTSGNAQASYEKFINNGHVNIRGDFSSEGNSFQGKENTDLKIGGIYQANIKETYDDKSRNVWDTFTTIHAKALELNGKYTCTSCMLNAKTALKSTGNFQTSHFIGLKSEDGVIELRGKILPGPPAKKPILAQERSFDKLSKLIAKMPQGIFIEGKKAIWHYGRTDSNASISYSTEGNFLHKGSSSSGFLESHKIEIQALSADLLGSLRSYGEINARIQENLNFLGAVKAQRLNAMAESIQISGALQAHTANLEGEKKIQIAAPALLKIEDTLSLQSKGEITHEGTTQAKNVIAQATSITNIGDITAHEGAHFKADHYFANLWGGYISAQDMTIDASLSLNLLSVLHASRSLTINALVDLNLWGIESAQHISSNSLFSLNTGLYLPSPSFDSLFSWDTVAAGIKAAAMTCLSPETRTLLNFGSAAYRVYRQAPMLYDRYQSLEHESRISDYIPLIVGLKDLGISSYSSYSALREIILDAPIPVFSIRGKPTLNSLRDHSYNALSSGFNTLLPTITQDALINLNMGVIGSGNISQRGLYSRNSGTIGAGNYTNDAFFATNAGNVLGQNVSFSNQNFLNAGQIFTLGQTNVSADDITTETGSHINGHVITLQGKHVLHQGLAVGNEKVQISATQTVETGDQSSVKGGHVLVSGQNILHQGAIVGGHAAQLRATDTLTTGTNSTTSGHQVSLTANKVEHDGLAFASGPLNIKGTGETNLGKRSRSSAQAVFIGTEEEDDRPSKRMRIEEGAKITAHNTVIKGGDVSFGGHIDANNADIRGQGLVTEVGSRIDSKAVNIQGDQILHQGNATGSDSIQVTATKTFETGDYSSLEGNNAQLFAQHILHKGKIATENDSTLVATNSLTTTSNSTVLAHQVSLAANTIEHDGVADATSSLNIKGTEETILGKRSRSSAQFTSIGTKEGDNDRSSKRVRVEDGAKITAQYASVEGENVSFGGLIKANHADIRGQDLVTEVGSHVNTQTLNIQGNSILYQGEATGNEFIQVIASKTLETGEHSSLKGKNVQLSADDILHKGGIAAKNESHVMATNSLQTASGATVSGHQVSLIGSKVEHDGVAEATSSLTIKGTEGTILGKHSRSSGKTVFIGSENRENTERPSKRMRIEDGAKVEAKTVAIAGDTLQSAGIIYASSVSFSSNNGEILRPEEIHANSVHIALGQYKGGAQGAIDTANHMTHAQHVVMDVSQDDFVNTNTQTIGGENREFIFKRVENSAPLHSTGCLSLTGVEGFKTTADIHAQTGLSTISSQGKHETLHGAVLSTTQGINHVEGAKGLVLQSVFTDEKTLKRAGYTGPTVKRVSGGSFDNTAGQTITGNLESTIAGPQYEYAIECPNNILSLNADGNNQVLRGAPKARKTFARTEDLSDKITESIEGLLYTEGGIRKAKQGSTKVNGKVEAKTLRHTYVAEKGSKKSGWFKQHEEEYTREDTDFYAPEIHAPEGFDFISSETSELEGIQFDVGKTSKIGAKGDVSFTASVARNHHKRSQSKWWGLQKKKSSGYQDTAQTAHIIGKEKIYIESETGKVVLQSPTIEVAQGGGIIAPKGTTNLPLILEYKDTEKTQALGVSWVGNRPVETLHPIVQRVTNLEKNDDGVTGTVSDVVGLASSAFNTTTHMAQSYNMRGNSGDFIASETGLGRVSVGVQKGRTTTHITQEIPGRLSSGGDFVIQTNPGQEADLRGMSVNIDRLHLDTDKLRLAGTQQTLQQHAKSSNGALSFDIRSPTTVTVSAAQGVSALRTTTYSPLQNNINHLHVLRADTNIEIQNANLSIGQSSGEQYSIDINDRQNEFHSKEHNEGGSLSIDVTTGMPVGGGVSVGYQDIHSYTTPQRSEIHIGKGENLQEVRTDHKNDKTTGGSFNLNLTVSVSSEETAFSMPLSVSGQLGETRFRVEPLIVNTEALTRGVHTIQRAAQIGKESYYREDTRNVIKDKIREECISRGLTEEDALLTREQMILAYDQAHSSKDENGVSQSRILNDEGPLFIDSTGQLRGEQAEFLRFSLDEHHRRQLERSNTIDRGVENSEQPLNSSQFMQDTDENLDSRTNTASQSQTNTASLEEDNESRAIPIILEQNSGEQILDDLDLTYTLRDGSSTGIPPQGNKNLSSSQTQANLPENGLEEPQHTRPVQFIIDTFKGFKEGYATISQFFQDGMEGKISSIEALNLEGGNTEVQKFLQAYFLPEADADLRFVSTAFKATEAVVPKVIEAYTYYQGGVPYIAGRLAYNHLVFPLVDKGSTAIGQSVSGFLHDQVGLSEPLSNDVGLFVKYTSMILADRTSATFVMKVGSPPTSLSQNIANKTTPRAVNTSSLTEKTTQKNVRQLRIGYQPPPQTLEAFPNAVRVRRKTSVQGGGHLRKRWQDDFAIYEWDYRHGAVEKYTLQGKHLGEFDSKTGQLLKPADPARDIKKTK